MIANRKDGAKSYEEKSFEEKSFEKVYEKSLSKQFNETERTYAERDEDKMQPPARRARSTRLCERSEARVGTNAAHATACGSAP